MLKNNKQKITRKNNKGKAEISSIEKEYYL